MGDFGMDERISVGAAANYIVSLYEKLDNKYMAGPIFVEKLVFIANLRHFYKTGYCFLPVDTQYISYPLGIVGLRDTITDYISSGDKVNKINYLLKEKHKLMFENKEPKNFKVKEYLSEIESIDSSIKDVLLETFIAFGSFEGGTLLNMYLEIKEASKYKNKKRGFILNEPDLKNLIPTKIIKNDLYQYITGGSNFVIATILRKETVDFIESVLKMPLEQFDLLKYSEKEEVINNLNYTKKIKK